MRDGRLPRCFHGGSWPQSCASNSDYRVASRCPRGSISSPFQAFQSEPCWGAGASLGPIQLWCVARQCPFSIGKWTAKFCCRGARFHNLIPLLSARQHGVQQGSGNAVHPRCSVCDSTAYLIPDQVKFSPLRMASRMMCVDFVSLRAMQCVDGAGFSEIFPGQRPRN